jgi:hypothetical protein
MARCFCTDLWRGVECCLASTHFDHTSALKFEGIIKLPLSYKDYNLLYIDVNEEKYPYLKPSGG